MQLDCFELPMTPSEPDLLDDDSQTFCSYLDESGALQGVAPCRISSHFDIVLRIAEHVDATSAVAEIHPCEIFPVGRTHIHAPFQTRPSSTFPATQVIALSRSPALLCSHHVRKLPKLQMCRGKKD